MAIKQVSTVDSNSTSNNLASEESILLLRKIVKLLESNAATDNTNRQKVSLNLYDSLGITGLVGSPNSFSNVDSLLFVTNSTPGENRYSVFTGTFGPNNLDSRYVLFDFARNSYANNARMGLKWS